MNFETTSPRRGFAERLLRRGPLQDEGIEFSRPRAGTENPRRPVAV